ncbi:hypothetical protein FTO60_12045 [Octadecabacter sp. SW4]|uniref:hypothetical protein n=1 Tax=Octadecabacter sp. SW4 TaxID=2602067 RepID=UPI0011C1EE42|nr:hypothetical protein [Octadecabacter sp. SW4]QEE36378.1 hypothetical protein FTO60_12045 [Octadecabacter sp. SW4]
MFNFVKQFHTQDDGAITVDWVVLTAAIIGLALAIIATIGAGAIDHSNSVGNRLTSQEILEY